MAVSSNLSFALPTEEELDDLLSLNEKDSNSTKRALKFGFSKLESFAKLSRTDLSTITHRELDTLLSHFYAGIRKADGTDYTKKSLMSIRYAIQRHYLDHHAFDTADRKSFPKSNNIFKAVLVKLKREGKGKVNHKPVISAEDMEKIQTSDQTNCSSPSGLQNKVFVDILTYFCYRGRENIRCMKPSDFAVESDENGLKYISNSKHAKQDTLTKNNQEDMEDEDESSNTNSNTNSNSGHGGYMYEIPKSDRCPVNSYLLYVSKLNPDCPFLWQRPKVAVPQMENEPWYLNMPLGVNTIATKVKDIAKKAGCSRTYTNHSIRATCITSLDSAGFETRDLMSVSGHRSATSLKHYSRTSDNLRMECGDKTPTMIEIKQEVDEEPETPATEDYQLIFIKQEVEEEDSRQDDVEEDSREDDEVEMHITRVSSSESAGNDSFKNSEQDTSWQPGGVDEVQDEKEEQSEKEAKRRSTKDKGSGAKAPARRAQKPPTPPREESSDWDVLEVQEVTEEVPEVPQEGVPTPEEGTPEKAPSQAAQRKEKKPRGAFKLKDQEEEAMVIEWIQENPLLWDQKDQYFKNKNQKDRLWAEKAQELGYEGQYLKTWYTDLRDFNTKLVRIHSGDGARVFTAREQWIMGQFQFLKERIRHRRPPIHTCSVHSSAAAKAAFKTGNLKEAERLAAEERRSLDDVDPDSTSSKRQRGSQEEWVENQYLEVLRKELAESQKRLTALQERESDDERDAYMKYVGKVVCKSTEDAYEDFQRVFMDWQARWKAQRYQQYQQHAKQHQWYQGRPSSPRGSRHPTSGDSPPQ